MRPEERAEHEARRDLEGRVDLDVAAAVVVPGAERADREQQRGERGAGRHLGLHPRHQNQARDDHHAAADPEQPGEHAADHTDDHELHSILPPGFAADPARLDSGAAPMIAHAGRDLFPPVLAGIFSIFSGYLCASSPGWR